MNCSSAPPTIEIDGRSCPIVVPAGNLRTKRPSIAASILHSILSAIVPRSKPSDSVKLETALKDREIRNELINQLLSAHSDGTVRVRFISAVLDYERTSNSVDKIAKAKQICALFVQEGSKFHLPGIPIDAENEMERTKFRKLVLLKEIMLRELLKNPLVVQYMKAAENHSIVRNDELLDDDD
jgi:hypothetical protein